MKLGGTVCLPCQLNIPFNNKQYALRFWWRKKNKKKIFKNFPLDWPHFYSIENDCLRIVNISSLDHGTYKCTGIVLWKKHQSVSVSATRELIVVNRDVNATGIYIYILYIFFTFLHLLNFPFFKQLRYHHAIVFSGGHEL